MPTRGPRPSRCWPPATLRAPRRTRTAATRAALQRHMAHELTLAGPHSGAYVYDMTTGKALFAERATHARPPASVEKLYTATTALELMGPTRALETTVLGAGHLAPGGVWEGNLYLRGGGDPTFGTSAFIASHYGGVGASVSTLAEQLVKATGIRASPGRWMGDESYFDSLRGEPSSDYAPGPVLEARSARWRSTAAKPAPNRARTRRPPTPRTSCARRCGPTAWWSSGGGGAASDPGGSGARWRSALADGRAAARSDAAAVGQLLRRDAA